MFYLVDNNEQVQDWNEKKGPLRKIQKATPGQYKITKMKSGSNHRITFESKDSKPTDDSKPLEFIRERKLNTKRTLQEEAASNIASTGRMTMEGALKFIRLNNLRAPQLQRVDEEHFVLYEIEGSDILHDWEAIKEEEQCQEKRKKRKLKK